MIRVICVSAGYVESHQVSHTCFYTTERYSDAESALNSLAKDLLRVYQADGEALPDLETLQDFITSQLIGIADDFPDEMLHWWAWTPMNELLDIPKSQWHFLQDCWAEADLAKRALLKKEK